MSPTAGAGHKHLPCHNNEALAGGCIPCSSSSLLLQAVWVYGGLLTKVFPNSYTLRATLACTCWALLGYVAHEMVSVSVRGRQQAAAGL